MVSLKMIVIPLSIILPFLVPALAEGYTCCYGQNQAIPDGQVIASFPNQCMQLVCNQSKNEARYYNSFEGCKCCEFNGKMYRDGERIGGICIDMTCKGGEWETNGCFDACCQTCNLKNDPHITTFDNYFYHWHGKCNYSITQLSNGQNEDFGIYGDFRTCNSIASCIDKTTFTDNPNTVIEIVYNQGPNVNVNNVPYVVGASVEAINVGGIHPVLAWTTPAGCNMFLGSQGYLLQTCEHEIMVWAYPNLLNQINGLCGHFNHYQPDDFTERSGISQPLIPYPFAFPNSWKTYEQSHSECEGSSGDPTVGDVCGATQAERDAYEDICTKLFQDCQWKCNKPSPFLLSVTIRSCAADLCIMKENGATDAEIGAWKEEMKNILQHNIQIEVKTTVGANPPEHEDKCHVCDSSCNHQSSVKQMVQIVMNHHRSDGY